MSKLASTHEEQILCPHCHRVQTAIVAHTVPFWSYVHICACGYTILESEWDKVPPQVASFLLWCEQREVALRDWQLALVIEFYGKPQRAGKTFLLNLMNDYERG